LVALAQIACLLALYMALGGFAQAVVPTDHFVRSPRGFQNVTILESGTYALPWPF